MGNSTSSNASGSGGIVDAEDNSSASDAKELGNEIRGRQEDHESSSRKPTCATPFICTSILTDPMPNIPSEMKNDFYTLGFIKEQRKEEHVPVPYYYWPVIQVDPNDTPPYIRNNWLHDTYHRKSMKRIVYRYSIDDFILIEADEIIPYNEGIEKGLDLLPKDIIQKLRMGKSLSILDLNLVLSRESLRVEARKPRKDRNVWKHADENRNNEIDVSQESLSGLADDERKSRELKRKRNHQSVGEFNNCDNGQFEGEQNHDTAHLIVTPEHSKKKKRKELSKARLYDMNLQRDSRVLDFGGESSDASNVGRHIDDSSNSLIIASEDEELDEDNVARNSNESYEKLSNNMNIENDIGGESSDASNAGRLIDDPSNFSLRASANEELDKDNFAANSNKSYEKLSNTANMGVEKAVDNKVIKDTPTSIGEYRQGKKNIEKDADINNNNSKNPQESFIGKRRYKEKKEKDPIFLDGDSDCSDSDTSAEQVSDSESISCYSISKSLGREIFQKDLNIYMHADRAKLEQEIMSNLSARVKESIHEVCFARFVDGKLYPVFVLSPFDLFPCESQSSYFTYYRQYGNSIALVLWYGYGQDDKNRKINTISESDLVHYNEGIEEIEETLDASDPKVRKGLQDAKKDKELHQENRLQWLFKAESAKFKFLGRMLERDPFIVQNYRTIGVIRFKEKPCPVLQICPLDIQGEIREKFMQSFSSKKQKKREICVLLYGEKSGAKNKFLMVEPREFTPIEQVPQPYPDDQLVQSKGGTADREYYLRWQHMRQDLNRSRVERPLSYSLMKEMQK